MDRPRPDREGCGDQRGQRDQEEELAEPEARLGHGRGLGQRHRNRDDRIVHRHRPRGVSLQLERLTFG